VNNSEQFGSDSVDSRPKCAGDHLRVHVERRVDLSVAYQLSHDFARHARSTLLGELGLLTTSEDQHRGTISLIGSPVRHQFRRRVQTGIRRNPAFVFGVSTTFVDRQKHDVITRLGSMPREQPRTASGSDRVLRDNRDVIRSRRRLPNSLVADSALVMQRETLPKVDIR
jgi:hypothetical protein